MRGINQAQWMCDCSLASPCLALCYRALVPTYLAHSLINEFTGCHTPPSYILCVTHDASKIFVRWQKLVINYLTLLKSNRVNISFMKDLGTCH